MNDKERIEYLEKEVKVLKKKLREIEQDADEARSWSSGSRIIGGPTL